MKRVMMVLGVVLTCAACSGADGWAPQKEKEQEHIGRKLEVFTHGVQETWGYAAPQRDTFFVLHPKQPRANAPLYASAK